MAQPRAIAVAQTIPARGAVDANLEEHVRLAHVAADERAEVVVFPELSLTGYEIGLADELAFSESDPRLVPLLDVASSRSLTVIVGAPVRVESRLHIGAFIVSPDRTVTLYTKHHLGAFSTSASVDGDVPPAEATVFHAGDRNPLVALGGGPAALAVCADAGRPSHAEAAARRGARAYLASMFVIPSEFAGETAKLPAYAERHEMAVAFANYGGPSGGLASAGRSAIWSEAGERLAELAAAGAGVAVAIEGPSGWRAKTVVVGRR
jgi:predicted amidohydrolase